MIHKISRVDVKVLAVTNGQVTLECEDQTLVGADGPRLHRRFRVNIEAGDSVSVTTQVDSETIAEFRRREVAAGG